MKKYAFFSLALALSGCTNQNLQSNTIQTSSDMVIVNAEVNKKCTQNQLIESVQKLAALSTLKSGYDSYIVRQVRGSDFIIDTTLIDGDSYSQTSLNRDTSPLPIITNISEKKDTSFQNYYTLIIQMFSKKDQARKHAIDARNVLGENWKKIVKKGRIPSCR